MSAILVETKKVSDLTEMTSPLSSYSIPVQDTESLKRLSLANLFAMAIFDNDGAHNSIYRGKFLGTSVTDEQYAEIEAGTFKDLFIGDYWIINGITWRIAAFNYYYNTGDTACTKYHVLIVPDEILDSQQMNETNTTEGGYLGSLMYTANMETAKEKIKSAFGEAHILTHRLYLCNATSSGKESGRIWVDSSIELMTEQNVYGNALIQGMIAGSWAGATEVDKSQYPLFALNPKMISFKRQWYWLRNVVSSASFADVSGYGYAYGRSASATNGVRPAFSIIA